MGLFPDFVQRLVPAPITSYDRSLGLEYALEQSWSKLAADCNLQSGNPFSEKFSHLKWEPDASVPALFINTTQVPTGRPVALSTAGLNNRLVTLLSDFGFSSDLRLSTAAALSARFPFITPAGWLEGSRIDWQAKLQPVKVHLVDGGYYDNSGTDLLAKLAMEIKNLAARVDGKIEVYTIAIGDAGYAGDEFILQLFNAKSALPVYGEFITKTLKDYPTTSAQIDSNAVSELASPLGTLAGSRVFRSRESVKNLLRLSGVNPYSYLTRPEIIPNYTVFNQSSFVFPLSNETPDMPLGWILSSSTRDRLAIRSGDAAECFASQRFPMLNSPAVLEKLKTFMSKHNEDIRAAVDNWLADCSLEAILRLKP